MSEFKSQVIQTALRTGRCMTQAEVAAANSEFIAWADKEITDLRAEMEVRVEQIHEKCGQLDQARKIITELVAFCEQPDIVAATDGAFDPDATIQAAKRFLSGGER